MYEEQVESRFHQRAREESMGAVLNHYSERDALIEEYHDFVESLVSRLMRAMGLPQRHRDDFISAGLLGLVEAAGRFDADRGNDFRAFAFLRIRGAVIDHIRASCELSGYAYQVLKALESAQDLRTQSLENRRSGSQSPGYQGMEGVDLLSKSAVALAIVTPASESPFFGGTAPSDPERDLHKKQTSEKLRSAIATLPDKERTIIEQYYFHDLTLSEVAQQYAGLSKSWVSRLHDRALGILREKLVEGGMEGKA
jgi:RNA polymerase sigma factor for flagellar operon FliA